MILSSIRPATQRILSTLNRAKNFKGSQILLMFCFIILQLIQGALFVAQNLYWPNRVLLPIISIVIISIILFAQLQRYKRQLALFYFFAAISIVLFRIYLGNLVDVSPACFCLLLLYPMAFPSRRRIIGFTIFMVLFWLTKTPFLIALWSIPAQGPYFATLSALFDLLSITFILVQFTVQKDPRADELNALQWQIKIMEKEVKDLDAMLRNERLYFRYVYHEIRNPSYAAARLAGTLVDFFKDSGIDDKRMDCLLDMAISTEYLTSVVTNLLYWSETSDVDMPPSKFTPVEIDNLLFQVVKVHQYQADAKHICLDYAIDKNVPIVIETDQQKISMILYNMLSNAVRYTQDHGSINVLVSTSTHSWSLSVQDNGPGIPVNKRTTLFEPVNTPKNPKTVHGSMGLGLPIMKWLADSMGASIQLTSNPGEGTTIILTLPFREEQKNILL